jgi:DNA mismatch repair ATPase MutL
VTSKVKCIEDFDRLETYGFHGEALSNIIQLSERFTIETSPKNHHPKFIKELNFDPSNQINKNYQTDLTRFEKVLNDKESEKFSTRIIIINLFGKFPIRQNQLRKTQLKCQIHLIDSLHTLSLINFDIEIALIDRAQQRFIFKTKNYNSLIEKFSNMFNARESQIVQHSFKHNRYEINGVFFQNSDRKSELFFSHLPVGFNACQYYVFVNKHFVCNKTFYDLIINQLLHNKEFNLVNLKSNEILFCLVFKCPSDEFKIEYIKRKSISVFHNENYVLSLLRTFLDTIYDRSYFKPLTYSTNNNHQINYVSENKRVKKTYGKQLNESDLKTMKVSKKIQKSKPKKLGKSLFQLNKTSSEKSNNIIKKFTYLDLVNAIKGKKQNIKKNTAKKVDKSTQTDSNELSPEHNHLDDQWMHNIDEYGIEYFVNRINGTTVYTLENRREKMCQHENIEQNNVFEMNLNLDLYKTADSKTENKLTRDFLVNINSALERNALIKWRNRDEFEKYNKKGSDFLDAFHGVNLFEELCSFTSFKIDKSIFRDLIVSHSFFILIIFFNNEFYVAIFFSLILLLTS